MTDDQPTTPRRQWAEAHQDMLEHLGLLWGGKPPEGMDFCGCGNPQRVWELIRLILVRMPLFEGDNRRQVGELLNDNDAALSVVLYVMTSAELLEHGSSIHGSWITPKGEWARWAIGLVADTWGWDKVDEMVDEFGLPHYVDVPKYAAGVCGPNCWKLPLEARP